MVELIALTNCDDLNIAGLPIIEYCPIVGIESFQVFELADGRLRGSVWFKPWFKWFRMPLRPLDPDRQLWTETQSSSPQGKATDVRIEGIFAQNSARIQLELDDMERHRYIVRVEDAAGRKFLVGTIKCPLQFKASFSTAKAGFNIEFFGKQPHKAVGY